MDTWRQSAIWNFERKAGFVARRIAYLVRIFDVIEWMMRMRGLLQTQLIAFTQLMVRFHLPI